jgi:signal transduction histidine kinase
MRKSGKIATCLLSAELLTINNEKCLLSSLDDITSRKEYELNLIASKEKAEESDRCKTAFLQNISHEIRTPLNAIVGFSSLLGDDDLDKESRKSYVDLITKSSEHLLTILNDIMEISNIEAGVSKFNKQEININILLNDLYKQFRYRAIEKGIDLRVVVDQSFRNPVIVTDSTKLIQVLSNLLNNALKFTEKGRIKYGYELKNNHIEFHVTDTGIGIPEDLFDKIFDRFYRIDTSPVKKYSGTGLGLAISKAFIELLGGEIWVKSTVGKGTTFYFTLPRVHF